MARTPTDPTKAQVWITKGLDDLDFEFYFPQGPKGDPGGFNVGTELPNANLDSIVTPGLYKNWTNTNATLLNNYPAPAVNHTGVLEVMTAASTADVMQRYTSVVGANGSGKSIYIRRFISGVWSTWVSHTSSRIDQTAGRVIYQWDDVNQRDQIIWGDTGWRDISSLLIAGATGTVKIRRITSDVHIAVNNLQLPAATIFDNFLPMPAGFNNSEVIYLLSRENAVNGEAYMFEWASNLKYRYNLGPTVANNTTNRFAFQGVSSTTQAWPTTLPGTAINGGIPNA